MRVDDRLRLLLWEQRGGLPDFDEYDLVEAEIVRLTSDSLQQAVDGF